MWNISKWLVLGPPNEDRYIRLSMARMGGYMAEAILVTNGRGLSPCYGYSKETMAAAISNLDNIILKE